MGVGSLRPALAGFQPHPDPSPEGVSLEKGETIMSDVFGGHADSVSGPATRAVAVVPHDGNPLPEIPKALFIGVGGDLVARGAGDTADVTFKNLSTGSVLPFRARLVRATGTTASAIVALY